jgi:uncharacterized membrane protein
MAVRGSRDDLRWPLGDNSAAAQPALRPHIDDPVRGFDYIEVVFNDDQSVATASEPLQQFQ